MLLYSVYVVRTIHFGDLSSFFFFFFKQKTAYEMRISDWSSDVCSSDLPGRCRSAATSRALGNGSECAPVMAGAPSHPGVDRHDWRSSQIPGANQIGSASCRERGCQYV